MMALPGKPAVRLLHRRRDATLAKLVSTGPLALR